MKKIFQIQEFEMPASAKAGIHLVRLESGISGKNHDTSKAHRDNHYLLLMATHGQFLLNLDFNEIIIITPALLLVLPGQVHHMLKMNEPKGWILSFDPSLLDDILLQQKLEDGLKFFLALDNDSDFLRRVIALSNLIENLQNVIKDIYIEIDKFTCISPSKHYCRKPVFIKFGSAKFY